MSKHILKLFSPSGTRTILVFLHQTLRQNSDGNPLTLNVGVKCSLHCRPVLQDGWVGARCPLSNTTPHLGPLGLAGLPTFAFLPPPCHCNFVNFNSILKYYFHQPTQSTKSIGPYKIDFLKPFITKQCSQARPSTGCLAARRLGTHYPQAFTREPADTAEKSRITSFRHANCAAPLISQAPQRYSSHITRAWYQQTQYNTIARSHVKLQSDNCLLLSHTE